MDVAGVLRGREAQRLVAVAARDDGRLGGLVVVAAREGAGHASEDHPAGRAGAAATVQAVVLVEWGAFTGGAIDFGGEGDDDMGARKGREGKGRAGGRLAPGGTSRLGRQGKGREAYLRAFPGLAGEGVALHAQALEVVRARAEVAADQVPAVEAALAVSEGGGGGWSS